MEIWKEIDGFEGYWISNYGQVKSVKPSGDLILKLRIKHSRKKNRLTKRENTGYVVASIRKNGVIKNLKVHRLVAIAFIPNPENKPEVNHIDGIKTNCYASNLEWSTHQENVDHAGEHGLRPNGERNGNAKLTDSQVIEIKKLLAEGKLEQKDIAKIFGIDHSVISNIKTRRSWTHIN